MVPGARNKFGAPMFEPEVFRKQMYCIKNSAYDIVVAFWSPTVIRRPGIVPPCPPSLHLWCYSIKIGKFSENKQIFKFERHELLLHERSAIFEHNRACILYRRPTKVTGGISRFYVWFLSYFYCKRPAEQRFCSGNVFVA